MMEMESIAPLAIDSGAFRLDGAAAAEAPAPGVFERVLETVENTERGVGEALADVATGRVGNLHQVMLSLEQSRLRFELFLQVRNRVLEAYQDIMRMQV
ncbi:flagellar hook-basal body complex protein FliE [Paludibacterium paludis]|uniref:Flagellar hook-basal body complex protein FliE n=1 Tax=Paludibacterium paludis TaxID=1225769 RepID=A0A918P722_9NEIS|nr:flagellar hook-basal body complex protein FliE [Paludibacterium paludis]GGY28827.1 hypothetical protein GCM10011289_35000 [Paludibacterium paludis]